jgi:hypothetical protein
MSWNLENILDEKGLGTLPFLAEERISGIDSPDLETQLIQDLQLPIKTFRLVALEQVIQHGRSLTILDALRKIQAQEQDPECALLLGHAIQAVDGRLKAKEKVEELKIGDPAAFLEEFFGLPETARAQLLANLTTKQASVLQPVIPALFERETNVFIKSRIVKVFFRKWPQESLQLLANHLFSESQALRLAVMEALVSLAPETLLKDLPRFLVAEEPRIRSLAIKGLAAIDFQEAMNHLRGLLLSPDESYKAMGIHHLVSIPFDAAKPLLLEFLAGEKNPSQLNRAGILFAANPDPEVPFKLWELVESSTPEKAELLKTIVAVSIRAFGLSGIPRDEFDNFKLKLQIWIQMRSATKFVQNIVQQISREEDPETQHYLEAVILQSLSNEQVLKVFKESLKWFISEKAKEKIKAILAGFEKPMPDFSPVIQAVREPCENPPKANIQNVQVPNDKPTVEPNKKTEVKQQPLPDLTRQLVSLTLDQTEEAKKLIGEILADAKSPPGLKAAAFRTARRFSLKDWSSTAEKLLHNPSESLLVSLLDYLALANPDLVFMHLGKFLQMPSPRIQAAALSVLKQFDPQEALRKIQTMISSPNDTLKAIGLNCMIHFDFLQVRPLLTDFLLLDPSHELFEQGLTLFQTNMESENLFVLFKISKAISSPNAKKAEQTLKETQTKLEKMGVIKAGEAKFQTAALEIRFEEERKAKSLANQAASYSYKKLHQAPKESIARNIKDYLQGLANEISPRVALSLGLAAVILVGLTFWSGRGTLPKLDKAGPIVAGPMPFSGAIMMKKDFSTVFAKSDKGESMILKTSHIRGFRGFGLGDKITGIITPYRMGQDGVPVADICDLKKKE